MMIQCTIPSTGHTKVEPSIILMGGEQVVTYFAKEVENFCVHYLPLSKQEQELLNS